VLARLIDHAALFPPASMALDEALEADEEARSAEHGWVIGRFVVPVAALGQLPGDGLPLSVVLRGPADVALVSGVAGVEAVEIPLDGPRPRSSELVAAYRELQPLGIDAYFELVLDDGWRDSVPAAVGALAAIGARAKLRCGGAAIPSVEQVALVIACCREAGVPFKATAGLHHAIRRGEEHGFLNLMAAVTAPRGRLADVLAEEDPAALELNEASRDLFAGFGSCSWREPVEDLRELGMLP
jgi:hypothetical protein